jgi:5'-nucleotidase
MKRRRFLRMAGGGAASALLLPDWVAAGNHRPQEVRLTILHTNDTHSRVDPFPMDGGPHEGLGGVARRSTLVEGVRAENPNVLLLDSGDIFQGTPYFNFFGGEIEFKAMSAMDYDVVTIGNHDFDNGVAGLVEMMPHASFQFVSANYDCSDSPLGSHVRPWVVRESGGVKVGIFGLGIAFEGLVLASLHEGVRYTDPFAAARRAVSHLREEGCSLVVCLSHLGYRYRGSVPSDTLLAQEVPGIDLILGGHTHTFMDKPDAYTHPDGSRTLVNQVGWAGMRLGRIDVVLEPSQEVPESHPTLHTPRAWGWESYTVDSTPA